MAASSGKDKKNAQQELLHDDTADYSGASLRAVQAIDIATLSYELRIPKNYIEALELEDYDVLPGTTYGYGYIRSYCKFLNIDAQPYLDTYKMRTAMQMQNYAFPDEALEPRMSGAMVAMLLVLVLLTGYIGWQVFDRYSQGELNGQTTITASAPQQEISPVENPSQSSDESSKAITQATGDKTSEIETDEAGDTVTETASKTDSQTAPSETNTKTTAQDSQTSIAASQSLEESSKPNTAETPSSETAQTAQAVDEATGSQDVVENEAGDVSSGASAQANVRVPSEEILISASAAAWVEVVSENGDVVLSKLFQPGDDYIAPADKKLYLSTGNAGGLVLQIPGLDKFNAGAVGEIIRDLPLSRDSIRSRRSAVSQ